jgi:Icc-related predicted phosphoesterase
MKAWIISDIHTVPLDWYRSRIAIPEADLCICAGDVTGNIHTSADYLMNEVAPTMPVVIVLGNHDYYGYSIDRALEIARRRLSGSSVHLLENESIVLGGVRFVGATLWTDFEVPHGTIDGRREPSIEVRRFRALRASVRDIADFRHIYRSDERKEGETGLITAQEMIARHIESRAFIDAELAEPFDGKTVVVTHHAPSPRSFHPAYIGSPTNGAFASELSAVIYKGEPWYWIHGHIHHASDYFIGKTRVLCNPKGYRHERDFTEFRPGLVIEI